MVKFIPLMLLGGMVAAVVVTAPGPREGLMSHDAAGKASVWARHPALNGGPHIVSRLRVNYVIAGLPRETYTVELWLGRTGDDRLNRYHFDTQEVTVPGENGGKLKEVTGRFDRFGNDRERPRHDRDRPLLPMKPGNYSLLWVELGKSWDCRLVVKKDGKVVSDTGYFRAVLDPVIEI